MSTPAALFKIINRKSAKLTLTCIQAIRKSHSKFSNIEPLPYMYGGKTNVTVLPGVGIGPEIMESTLEVLNAAEAPLIYDIKNISTDEEEEADFVEVLSSIKRNKVAIKANIEVRGKNLQRPSRNVTLRKILGLYVYVLPLRTLPGVKTRFGELDLVMIRQNSEGEYLMLEHEPVPGSVESLKVLTTYNTERLVEFAYDFAIKNERKRLTIIHTASVQMLTEGLFLDVALRISKKYPSIETNVKDAARVIVEIMKEPRRFDVLLATNLNGAIISNLLNGMIGGPALSAGMNFSESGLAVFEPGVRNKGSGIVGKGVANPTAMLMAASSMLSYLGHRKKSHMIMTAINKTLVEDRVLTRDLGGEATTREFTDNLVRHVKNLGGRNNLGKGKYTFKRWDMRELEKNLKSSPKGPDKK